MPPFWYLQQPGLHLLFSLTTPSWQMICLIQSAHIL